MKKYVDYSKNKRRKVLTEAEIKTIRWTQFKIIVPTLEDKNEIIEAFKHFHDSAFNSDYITANQLAHEYLDGSNIIVDDDLFFTLELE